MKKLIRQRIIGLFLIVSMISTFFTGCSTNNNNNESKSTQENKQTKNDSTQTSQKKEETKNNDTQSDEDWGVECRMYFFAPDVSVHISFPKYPGDEYGTGMYANQPDQTITIFDTYNKGVSSDVNDIKKLFPACGVQVKPMFENHYRFAFDNSRIDSEYDSTETIGNYEVTKFNGVHHYTLEGEEKNCQFVVYAVELHKAEMYAYVMIQDISKDQSQKELIKSHAYNMIKSMREE